MLTYSIKPFKNTFSEEDIEYILSSFGNIMREGQYLTMGRYGEEFESNFSQYHGQKYAISVSSGTAALEIILKTINVQGGKVIVPTNTFGATIIPVLRAGATPVFADCCEDLTISPEDVARKLTNDVKAVITVHIGGLISPHTLDLQQLCKQKSIPLVEDAAHAVGSALGGKKAGSFGIAAAFSFFATKVITCGEGGMILTSDERINLNARLLRNHAKSLRNCMEDEGYNWRLTEAQAIMGIRQLAHLDEFIAKRNRVAQIYDYYLEGEEGFQILIPPSTVVHNRYKYILVLDTCRPQKVEDLLKKKYDITLGGYVYEEPCHKQPAFRKFDGSNCLMAEKLCASHICLPIYQSMHDDETHYVAESVRSIIRSLSHGQK